MEPPKYENGSVNEYLRKVQEFKIKLNNEKYNKILLFINKILKLNGDLRYNSLLKFKNINENVLFNDTQHLLKVFFDEYKKLCDYLNIKNDGEIVINGELNKDKEISLINCILSKINYKIFYRSKNNVKYYYIKN